MQNVASQNFPRLVGDIGGTNIRLAVITAAGEAPAQIRSFACSSFPGLDAAILHYLATEHLALPPVAAFGIATPLAGDAVRMTNHAWAFSIEALRLALGFERLVFINDFTALALALPHLQRADIQQIGGGTPQPNAPLALLGAGTGLGVSGLIPCGAGWQPLAGEGGHVSLAAGNAREAAIIAVLAARFGHVSAERALSGPGIAALHDAIRQLEGAPPCQLDSREISARALAGSCPYCSEALEVFCALLGSVAADLALTLGARGGVYVGGGIVPALGAYFARSGFRARFEAKGRFSAYLAGIPTYVIRAPYAALSGADEALDRATPAPPMPPEATK